MQNIKRRSLLLVGLLLVVSAVLRFTNSNWDAGHQVHPDEKLIVNGAMNIRFFSNLNPGFHDYNGFPVYLLRASADIATAVSGDRVYSDTPQGMTVVGRTVSAAVSTLSVLLLYLLTLQYFPPVVSVLSATAFSFSPILIQLAHFYTTDTLLVAYVLLLMLAVMTRRVVLMAIPLSLAIATKNTGFLLFPIPMLAIFLIRREWAVRVRDMLILCVVTGFGFFLFSPHTFLDFVGYIERSRYLQAIASGTLVFDWSTQFLHTGPLYWLTQTVVAFGPMAVIGPIGLVFLIRDRFVQKKHEKIPLFILSIWTIGCALSLSFAFLKFIRYNSLLAAGYALGFSYMFVRSKRFVSLRILLIIALIVQCLWGLMFFSIYLTPHTTIQAGNWIETHIPSGSTVLYEDWNSSIRYDLAPLVSQNIRLVSFNFYAPDSGEKLIALSTLLSTADYIVFDSPKVRNTIVRLTNRYPYTANLYTLLEEGKLGFTAIQKISSYPKIGMLVLPDEWAEETFYVFDHPTVNIYRNELHLSADEILNLVKARP